MTDKNNQVAKITPINAIRKDLEKQAKEFKKALGKQKAQIPSEKFIRIVMTALQDKKILEQINKNSLDKGSLYSSCQRAAAQGLLLDNKEAALLTFWNKDLGKHEAQYVPMVEGIVKLAHQSGEVKTILREVVREGDLFEYWINQDGYHLKWVPGEKRGKGIKVFAIGLTVNGGRYIEVMDEASIMRIAAHSKNTDQYDQTKGKWWESWWKKAAVRRVCKLMPNVSSKLEEVFETDNESFDFSDEEPEIRDVTEESTAQQKEGGSKAASKVIGKNKKKDPEPKAKQQAQDTSPPDPGSDDPIDGEFEEIPEFYSDEDFDMI